MTTTPVHNILEVLAFGELLQHHINDAGFGSLSEFARAAGTTPTTVANCVNGKVGPPLDQLERWCDALKLRGKVRTEFIHSAWRTKAWSQSEANPWLRHVEAALGRSKKHMRSARALVEWQAEHIARLEQAVRDCGQTPPIPPTDPPELPSPDDEPLP